MITFISPSRTTCISAKFTSFLPGPARKIIIFNFQVFYPLDDVWKSGRIKIFSKSKAIELS